MKDFEISTASELAAASLGSEFERHKGLWRVLSVHMSWFALFGWIAAASLLVYGLVAGDEVGGSRLWSAGVGAFMIVQMQMWWALSQGETIGKLLKRLEKRVTRLEKNVYAGR